MVRLLIAGTLCETYISRVIGEFMIKWKSYLSKILLWLFFIISLYVGFGEFLFKLIILNDKFEGGKSKIIFTWVTSFIPNNLNLILSSLILLVIVYLLLEFRNDVYFTSINPSKKLLIYRKDTFSAPRIAYKVIGVIFQLEYIYNSILQYGVAATGNPIIDMQGIARYNAVRALLGGGALSIGGGGMKLGNIVLIVLFFYILVVTFLIDYFINKLSTK